MVSLLHRATINKFEGSCTAVGLGFHTAERLDWRPCSHTWERRTIDHTSLINTVCSVYFSKPEKRFYDDGWRAIDQKPKYVDDNVSIAASPTELRNCE